MNSMWIAITIIAVVAMLTGGWNRRHQTRSDKHQQAEIEALRARLDELDSEFRDRIQTLEKIVTDDKENLRREIDYLDKAS